MHSNSQADKATDLLSAFAYNGCFTGDCPHDTLEACMRHLEAIAGDALSFLTTPTESPAETAARPAPSVSPPSEDATEAEARDLLAELARLHPTRGVFSSDDLYQWAERFAELWERQRLASRRGPSSEGATVTDERVELALRVFYCETEDGELGWDTFRDENKIRLRGHMRRALEAVSQPAGRAVCDTTATERRSECSCVERTDALGACKVFKEGANGRCVYCDHEFSCHSATDLAAGRRSANDSFEEEAAAFFRATGMLAPGKSVPMEMASEEYEDERRRKWADWTADPKPLLDPVPLGEDGLPCAACSSYERCVRHAPKGSE